MPHSNTVGAMFRETAARFPQNVCFESGPLSLSYAEEDAFSDRIAAALLALGLEKGSRAGVWCKNGPEYLGLYLAMQKLGVVPVLLNTALRGAELNVLLKKADVRLLFYDDGDRGVQFPQELAAVEFSDTRYVPDFLAALPPLTEQGAAAVRRAEAAVTPEDPDVILYTSGSSGPAKGVLTDHRARVLVTRAQVEAIALTEADKLCVALPMYHCFALTGVILAALCCGASLYFPPERRTKALLESVSLHRCTVLSAVPTLFNAIISRQDLGEYDLSSLRTGYIGGSLYTPDFFRRVEAALHFRLAPSLGQTEATAGFTFLSPEAPDELRCYTVGRFMEGLEYEIRDVKTGSALPPGQSGEICIRGPSVMLGYWGDRELTRQALDDTGWLRTGDLGWLDPEGCLHLSGRLKEIIIRGGENIAPGEIEALLETDPRVREAKAVAVPDPHYGEEVCACVALLPGSGPIDGEELRELVRRNLAAYKVPRYVLFLDALPRNAGGKVILKELKKLAAEKLGL